MRYLKIFVVLSLVLIIFTGCRKKQNQTKQQPKPENKAVEQSFTSKVKSFFSGKKSKEDIKREHLKSADEKDFFVNKRGNYKNITYFDVTDWTERVSSRYGLRVLIPRYYLTFENDYGIEFNSFIGENFFKVFVDHPQKLEDFKFLRSKIVKIYGYDFVLKEFTDEAGYYAILLEGKVKDKLYSFVFYFEQDNWDRLDLFLRAIESLKFL